MSHPIASVDAAPRLLVRKFIERLQKDGFYVTISTEMAGWVKLMKASPRITTVNPTFDPDYSQLDATNSFWIRITDMADNPVACIANRLFVTDDYVGLMRSCRLWYDKTLTPVQQLNIVLDDRVPVIAGRIGHHGGLWVHPGHRKRGFSYVLPRLVRSISLTQFLADWHCGIVLGDLADSRLPIYGYGYTGMDLAIDGYFPVMKREDRVYMTSISRPEMLDQARRDLDLLELHADKQLVDVVAIACEGQGQPGVAARGVVHEGADVLVPRRAGVLDR
jgi:hypothetical protein